MEAYSSINTEYNMAYLYKIASYFYKRIRCNGARCVIPIQKGGSNPRSSSVWCVRELMLDICVEIAAVSIALSLFKRCFIIT